jgi:endonuclease/exonuclease/phosphatase family metal-dependent hydrolase
MSMKTYYWLNQNRFLSHLALLPRLAMRLAKSQFAWALMLVSGVVLITPNIATAEDTHNTVFSVMTRNMDLGSDYAPALAAHDAESFVQGVTTIYNEIVASNIAERAASIAREIQETMPTVVSLQEVSLVQRLLWDGTQWSLLDQIDQLAALRTALAQLGLSYSLAIQVYEFDVTAPSDNAGHFVRVRDSEAILVRSDLPANILTVSNPQTGHYTHLLSLQTPVGTVIAIRGWASIDITAMGSFVRIIDTHLEVLSALLAAQQANELLIGPATTNPAVVVAGDLNSGPGTTTGAYDVIAAAMTDTWSATKPNDPGLTLPLHGEDFFPYETSPDRRIDLIFTRGLHPVTDILIGTDDLTPSGLYPSDHAGVVARVATQ